MVLIDPAWAETTSTREQVEATLARLDRTIAETPNSARHYVERGDAYYLLNDFHRAVADYSTALTLDDAQDKAYFGRGMAYGRMGLIDEGIADLSVYLARHPKDSVAYTKRGVRNLWRGNWQEAERDLTRAVELDPNNAEAHDDLGVVHAQKKIYALAYTAFLGCDQIRPQLSKSLPQPSHLFSHGRAQRCRAGYSRCRLAPDQDNRSSLQLKVAILQALGRSEEARKIAEHAEFLPEDNWSERAAVGIQSKQEDKNDSNLLFAASITSFSARRT